MIQEKNRLQNLNHILKDLSPCIFYFFNHGLRNFKCDVTAWTILFRVFKRATGSCIRTLNYEKPIFYSITKIVELSVYSTVRFKREFSKP